MTGARYIVLFRGVGGATQLPVKQLRQILSGEGFAGVATYINSGNAVLTASAGEEAVRRRVADLVRKHMGFEKAVMLRSLDDWRAMIAGNPFRQAENTPTCLHVYALECEPDPERVRALEAKATGTEEFRIEGRTLYLHTPDGMGQSRFAPKMEPTLKLEMTGRNWRSMLALRTLAAEG
ncbi:DUF1697 domain-containing protein [uncultured Nitratireductor sp.]|uniref:DUF1697 domain-containing protein n=1 Tax=uncultured Nitratireductor sp. TaxID=520953 RepID=UPI0025EEE255|nr:DUF1697 domain-containing protein [uncultured Nitratireductor sp.]